MAHACEREGSSWRSANGKHGGGAGGGGGGGRGGRNIGREQEEEEGEDDGDEGQGGVEGKTKHWGEGTGEDANGLLSTGRKRAKKRTRGREGDAGGKRDWESLATSKNKSGDQPKPPATSHSLHR